MKTVYTNKRNLPEKICKAIERREYKGYVPEAFASVSGLLKPDFLWAMGQYFRSKDITVYQDYGMSYSAMIGSGVHEILSLIDGPYIKEKTFTAEIEVDGKMYLISGTPDLYDTELQAITDFKTTSIWTVIYNSRAKEWQDQLNFYAWILEKNNLPVKSVAIDICLKDWSKTDAERREDYPQSEASTAFFQLRPVQENEEIIRNIIRRKIKLLESLNWGDSLPGCSAEERWQKETVYAVMKDGNTRATKTFTDRKEAEDFLKTKDAKHFIETRPGRNVRCEEWCLYGLNGICPAFQKPE